MRVNNPADWPQFTAEQRKRLEQLNVLPEQIGELHHALSMVKLTLYPRATLTAVRALLTSVESHAEALMVALGKMATQFDSAHTESFGLIEEAYWNIRREDERQNDSATKYMPVHDDDGATLAHHLIPRLSALAQAANLGLAKKGAKPTRHRTASPQPIRWIESALLRGWNQAHGSRVVHGRSAEEFEEKMEAMRKTPPMPPYPRNFRPSDKEGCAFREIVSICYEAAGAPSEHDPLRAIRSYLKQRSEQRENDRRAMFPDKPGPKNRTPKK
jgi:hypothetical protein